MALTDTSKVYLFTRASEYLLPTVHPCTLGDVLNCGGQADRIICLTYAEALDYAYEECNTLVQLAYARRRMLDNLRFEEASKASMPKDQ